jgi:uncharacterized protein (DUF1800 family)
MPLPELGCDPDCRLGLKRAAHLLRRATFGATKAQIDGYANLTAAEAVTQLFRTALPDPALPVDPATGTEWVTTGPVGETEDGDLQEYFKGWFIGQMMSAGISPTLSLPYSAREKLVLFYHTHFTCIQEKVGDARAMYYQNQLLRLYVRDAMNADPLVNFKDLTVKVSIDNAMLRLLDGNLNVKGSPNENYARELLELYTIGRGFEYTIGTPTEENDYIVYTEQDVQAAANVLSGWDIDSDFLTIDEDTALPRGKVKGSAANASAHETDPELKTFSARMGNAVIDGDPLLMPAGVPTEESCIDEIQQLIDLIYSQPETAKNICRKVYRFFVQTPHTEADALPIENVIISEMANTFTANGYKLQPVIENLLRSQHFYEAAGGVTDDNFGGIIKSPIDLTLGTLRFFDIQIPDMTASPTEFYEATVAIRDMVDDLGMKFYQPFDVAGYDAYHQFPIYHRAWITPNYLARRYEVVRSIVSPPPIPGMFKAELYNFVLNNFSNAIASNSRSLIIELAKYLLPVTDDSLTYDEAADDSSPLTAPRLNYFKIRLLSNLSQENEAYWTTRWTENATDLEDQLAQLFNAMLQSPEYQLA